MSYLSFSGMRCFWEKISKDWKVSVSPSDDWSLRGRRHREGRKVRERKGFHLRCSFTSPTQPSCITSLYLRWFPMSNLVFLLLVDNHDNANSNNLFFLFKLLLDPETLLSVGCPSSYKSSWGGISKLWSHEKSPKWMEWILAHFLSTHCLFSPPGFKPMSFLCCFPVTLYQKFSLAHILIHSTLSSFFPLLTCSSAWNAVPPCFWMYSFTFWFLLD